jgi:hypothetical protein
MKHGDDRRGYIHTCQETDLQTLQALLQSGPRWAYVARLAEADLVACTRDLPVAWSQGRAFGKTREVRWQMVGEARYRVDVLTEEPDWAPPDDGTQFTTLEVNGVQERAILLWGEMGKTPQPSPEWIEVRIPQPLKYPLEEKEIEYPADPQRERPLLRVVIHGYDYTVGDMPVATRWARLEQDRRGVAPRKE